jgi:hypothetical protein
VATFLTGVRRATAFDPRFAERSPLFWPLARALRDLGDLGSDGALPEVAALGRVFDRPAPVRFVASPPRPRRRRHREGVDVGALYDARITLESVVPTRPGSLHDFMNALVWGTFPAAKLALHARQHRAIAERIPPGARTLPPTRTRELDALALLDEGGVILPVFPPGARARAGGGPIVFGHAIYESLALGVRPAVVAALELPLEGTSLLAAADAALAARIEDRASFGSPEELSRVDLIPSIQEGAWAIESGPFR